MTHNRKAIAVAFIGIVGLLLLQSKPVPTERPQAEGYRSTSITYHTSPEEALRSNGVAVVVFTSSERLPEVEAMGASAGAVAWVLVPPQDYEVWADQLNERPFSGGACVVAPRDQDSDLAPAVLGAEGERIKQLPGDGPGLINFVLEAAEAARS